MRECSNTKATQKIHELQRQNIHVAKAKQRQTKATDLRQEMCNVPIASDVTQLWFRDFVETLRGQGVLHVASSKALEKSGGGLYDDTARALANVHPVPAL